MKTLDEFVALFEGTFYSIEPGTIKADTVFHDLEQWSSLVALCIIAMVWDEFRVTINGDELHELVTVEDLYQFITSRI